MREALYVSEGAKAYPLLEQLFPVILRLLAVDHQAVSQREPMAELLSCLTGCFRRSMRPAGFEQFDRMYRCGDQDSVSRGGVNRSVGRKRLVPSLGINVEAG
jgi:hypothetical protein